VAAPQLAASLSHADSCGKRLQWLAVTALCIAYSGAVSFSFPYFSVVMAIIASLGDLMSMFGLPCLFSLKLLKLGRTERCLCWLLVALSVGLSAAGVLSSFAELAQAFMGGGGGGGGGEGGGLLLSSMQARLSLA
jgi:vesicular inhibitory amino acid transporter